MMIDLRWYVRAVVLCWWQVSDELSEGTQVRLRGRADKMGATHELLVVYTSPVFWGDILMCSALLHASGLNNCGSCDPSIVVIHPLEKLLRAILLRNNPKKSRLQCILLYVGMYQLNRRG